LDGVWAGPCFLLFSLGLGFFFFRRFRLGIASFEASGGGGSVVMVASKFCVVFYMNVVLLFSFASLLSVCLSRLSTASERDL